jgi:hypothetical protein
MATIRQKMGHLWHWPKTLDFGQCLCLIFARISAVPVVVLFYLQLPHPSSTLRAVWWQGKSTVTFSDMMTCVRRALWVHGCFHTQADAQEFSKLSPSLQETILYALAPAA